MWETAPGVDEGSIGVAQLDSLLGKVTHLWAPQKPRQKDTDEKERLYTA